MYLFWLEKVLPSESAADGGATCAISPVAVKKLHFIG
jgi:hypothetical protein